MGERLNDSGLTRVLQKIKTLFVLNSKDSDGMVLKGSGQANKVWKTNAQGEPAWRDEETGTVTVTDNNPTLVWNTQSKVGTINGTDLHVAMPENPDTWRPVVDGLTSSDADKSLSAKQGKILNDRIENLRTKNYMMTTHKKLILTRIQQHQIYIVIMSSAGGQQGLVIASNGSVLNLGGNLTGTWSDDATELTVETTMNWRFAFVISNDEINGTMEA